MLNSNPDASSSLLIFPDEGRQRWCLKHCVVDYLCLRSAELTILKLIERGMEDFFLKIKVRARLMDAYIKTSAELTFTICFFRVVGVLCVFVTPTPHQLFHCHTGSLHECIISFVRILLAQYLCCRGRVLLTVCWLIENWSVVWWLGDGLLCVPFSLTVSLFPKFDLFVSQVLFFRMFHVFLSNRSKKKIHLCVDWPLFVLLS